MTQNNSDRKIDVLILSAGKGTRTKTIFPNTPKALIEYNGNKAIESVLTPFKDTEIYRISLNIRKDEIDSFKEFGFNTFVEDIPLGNAGAIKMFGKSLSDPFLVSHNDIYLPNIDAAKLYIAHLQNDSFLTMSVTNVGKDKERGIIVKKYNKVLGFTRERWINCGLYCVSHKVFEFIEDGFQDIDTHLLPRLSAVHQLTCYEYNGFYEDWGR